VCLAKSAESNAFVSVASLLALALCALVLVYLAKSAESNAFVSVAFCLYRSCARSLISYWLW
jgi:hypothetical protein